MVPIDEGKSSQKPVPIRRHDIIHLVSFNCGGLTSRFQDEAISFQHSNHIDILGLCETHQRQDSNLISVENLLWRDNILFSKHPPIEDPCSGVAMLLSERMRHSLILSRAVSSRILYARFKGWATNLSVVQCYAPHYYRKKPSQDEFYAELQRVCDEIPEHDAFIIMGDMNAKAKRNIPGLTGRWSIHGQTNCCGEHMLRFMSRNHLAATQSYFHPRRGTTNATYLPTSADKSPGQIDHVLTPWRWFSSILNVKTRWDLNKLRWKTKRDHAAIHTKLRLRLRQNSCNFESKLQNVTTYPKLFDEKVIEHTHNLDLEKHSLQRIWHRVSSATTAAMADLPSNKSNDYHQQLRQPQSGKKELKQVMARFKRKRWNDFVNQQTDIIANAVNNQNNHEMHKAVSKLTGKRTGRRKILEIDHKTKKKITSEKQRLRIWEEYLSREFDTVIPPTTGPIAKIDIPAEISINVKEPTLSEVQAQVMKMKNFKAVGIDGIPSECLKASGRLQFILWSIIKRIWKGERIPEMWSTAKLVMLYKKGDHNDPANYRPIALLSHAFKVLTSILKMRLQPLAEATIEECQAGFRLHRGCRDNLLILRILQQELKQSNESAFLTFFDFAVAFPSVSHAYMIKALQQHGIPEVLRNIISHIYSTLKIVVRGQDDWSQNSNPFRLGRGVNQGCGLSPLLFIFSLDSVLRDAKIHRKRARETVKVLEEAVESLLYADDLASIDATFQSAQDTTDALKKASEPATMQISAKKSKHMKLLQQKPKLSHTSEEDVSRLHPQFICPDCKRPFFETIGLKVHQKRWCTKDLQSRKRSRKNQAADKRVKRQKLNDYVERTQESLSIGLDKRIPPIFEFCYLGQMSNATSEESQNIDVQLAKAYKRFHQLTGIWKDNRLSRRLKMKLYKVYVVSCVTYASETWVLDTKTTKKLRHFQSICLATILNRSPHEILSEIDHNNENQIQTENIDLLTTIRQRQWLFLRSILRHPKNYLPKRLIRMMASRPHQNIQIFQGLLEQPFEELELEALSFNRASWMQKLSLLTRKLPENRISQRNNPAEDTTIQKTMAQAIVPAQAEILATAATSANSTMAQAIFPIMAEVGDHASTTLKR